MRIRSILVLGLLLLSLPAAAVAAGKCGEGGEHEAAVLAAREAIRAGCDCTGAASHAAYVRCAQDVIAQLADGGALPRMCRGRLRQYASRSTCGREHLDVCCESRDAFHVRAALRRDGECRVRGTGSFCVSTFPHADEACVQTGTVCRPSVCGDGITDRRNGEGCEPPGVGLCDAWCQVIVCGNGVLDPGEQCEPPNTPTCTDQCYIRRECGNGVVDSYDGEECEPPGTALCDASCRYVHECGNGVVELGEECDGQAFCNGSCQLTRSLCCQLGTACFDGTASHIVEEYFFAKGCSYQLGGSTSHGVCQGTQPCPPPAPPELDCRIGTCGDEPIDPLPLCCQHPDGTCTGSVATTAGSVGGCGWGTFPPPVQGDVEHLMVGTCGTDGRCVPGGGTTTP